MRQALEGLKLDTKAKTPGTATLPFLVFFILFRYFILLPLLRFSPNKNEETEEYRIY